MTDRWRAAGRRGPTRWAAALAALTLCLGGCASTRPGAGGASSSSARPGRSVEQTIARAITVLERYECAAFAVNFLNPIKREQIADLDAYRSARACSATDRGNLDDVILALRLARGARPEITGVKAVIDLSGIGLKISRFEFVRYTDGLWYFNEL